MPQSAVDAGHVDFVLPAEDIAAQLSRIGHHNSAQLEDDAPAVITTEDADQLHNILLLLQRRSGVDFRHYRRLKSRPAPGSCS